MGVVCCWIKGIMQGILTPATHRDFGEQNRINVYNLSLCTNRQKRATKWKSKGQKRGETSIHDDITTRITRLWRSLLAWVVAWWMSTWPPPPFSTSSYFEMLTMSVDEFGWAVAALPCTASTVESEELWNVSVCDHESCMIAVLLMVDCQCYSLQN